ncbi:MAG: YezD family protein [Verrucomicrobiota bacterium]
MSSPASSVSTSPDYWLHLVRQKAQGLRFGSIQIVVHEDRVTLVESTEKIRFSGPATASSPAKSNP